MNNLLEDFIPRSQNDRMALATYQILEEINENLKRLVPQQTIQMPINENILINADNIQTGVITTEFLDKAIESGIQIENEQGEIVKPKRTRKPKTEVSE